MNKTKEEMIEDNYKIWNSDNPPRYKEEYKDMMIYSCPWCSICGLDKKCVSIHTTICKYKNNLLEEENEIKLS